MKDMPAEIPDGLCIGAIPQREVASDVLISRKDLKFMDLPGGAVIGTSSLRRAAQLRHARPDIEIAPLRGNLDTRLKKLETENLDAIVLAAAGVKRLELEHRITEYLDSEVMLPAVGQGALCIEMRQRDPVFEPMVKALDDPQTRAIVLGERAFLNRLGGSCPDLSGTLDSSESIGISLAETLISRGANRILEKLQAMESAND
jgi:hydroxymethylbilane synthase